MSELNIPGPQADFSPGRVCYQRCLDWIEKCKLMINGPLQAKSAAVKARYVQLWAGKTARMHLKSLRLSDAQKANPMSFLPNWRNGLNPSPMSYLQQQHSDASNKVIYHLQNT